MYGKVLVGYEDTERGREALALGQILANAANAVLRIATVTHDGGTELAALARSEGADLIVIGSSRRGAVSRVVPGSTVEHLLGDASCLVAVAPPGFGRVVDGGSTWRPLAGDGDDTGMRVIGVGFDSSAASRKALDLAAGLAISNGATLRVYAVARKYGHVPGDGAGGQSPGVPSEAEALRERLHRTVAELPAETRALPVFLRGVPTTELIHAVDYGVDLLVLGTRPGGPLRRALHGSVSAAVLQEVRCPVLISPSGVDSTGGPDEDLEDAFAALTADVSAD